MTNPADDRTKRIRDLVLAKRCALIGLFFMAVGIISVATPDPCARGLLILIAGASMTIGGLQIR